MRKGNRMKFKFKLITIACDKCGWEKENQKIKAWLNKKCPHCNDYVPINKIDMQFYRFGLILEGISFLLKRLWPSTKTRNIRVSSREFRDRE